MKSHIKQNQLRKNLQTTPYHDILVCSSSWVCPKAFTTASFSSAMEAPLGTWISAIMKRYFQIEITSKQSLTYNYMQSSGFPISIPKQEPSSLRTDSLRSCWGSFWYAKLFLMPQSSGWGEDEDAIPHMQASKNTGPRPGIMWKPLLQNILSIRIWVCVFSFFLQSSWCEILMKTPTFHRRFCGGDNDMQRRDCYFSWMVWRGTRKYL